MFVKKPISIRRTGCERSACLIALCLAGALAWRAPAAEMQASDARELTGTNEPAATLARDPFWPVNYRPPRPSAPGNAGSEQTAELEEMAGSPPGSEARAQALAALKVGGIIRRGNNYFAAVNGQMVQVGDVIAVPTESFVFRFRIRGIDMRKVRIEPMD